MRFAFIAKHRRIWPVSWLCEVLEVSRSGFHAWLTRPLSDRAILDAKLVTAIDTSETVQNFVPWRILLRHWEAVFEHDRELAFDGVPFAD